jgi:hypothetical protein
VSSWAVLCCAVLATSCGRIGFDVTGGRGGDDVTTDGALDDGAGSPSCPAFATFCENFESGDLSKWTYTDYTGNDTTARVVGTRIHGGSFALDADVPTGGQDHAASPVLTFAARSTGTLAVREWINAAQLIQNFNVVLVLPNDQTGQFVTVGGDDAGNWVSSDNTAGNVLLDHRSTVATAPLDQWTCVELVFTFPQNATPARIQVFINEAAVLDQSSNDPSPVYNGVGVGIPRADNGGFHVFTDDVVIADQRIGCQ